jgi:dienelactone hydrolase
MAEKAMARLRRSNFAYPMLSLTYDHAGHGITRPHTSTMELNSRRHPISGRLVQMGGTPAGTAKAREDSWRQLLTFVDQHLRAAAPR